MCHATLENDVHLIVTNRYRCARTQQAKDGRVVKKYDNERILVAVSTVIYVY